MDLKLTQVGWREYYGNGILEGLLLKWNDGTESDKYCEASRYPIEHTANIPSNSKFNKV